MNAAGPIPHAGSAAPQAEAGPYKGAMTTLGFHYFPDETHYRRADLQAWLPELEAVGARWLTLIGSLTRAVPEPFIKGLFDAGIEPIIHLPAMPTRRDAQESLAASLAVLFRTYARWGIKYVVAFSEPNSRAAWAPAEWGKAGLVERFLDMAVPVLVAQHEAGLRPTFPALKAGGEYWDTAFLEASLAGLAKRGHADLLKQMTFAVNLWTFNRPVDWGQGGLRRWPEARPYMTPPGSQDQRGFRIFEWYDEIIRDRVGETRPLLSLAAGPVLDNQLDPQFPPVNELWHASCIQEISQAAIAGELPRNLLNVNFWLLAAPEGSPFAREAWYRTDGQTLTAVDALKTATTHGMRVERRRTDEAKGLHMHGMSTHPAAQSEKGFKHYVLLPTFEWGVSEWHWHAALDYVRTKRPVCGFSPEEALQAEHVTIFGNEQGISAEVEAELRRAGCTVDRLRVAQEA